MAHVLYVLAQLTPREMTSGHTTSIRYLFATRMITISSSTEPFYTGSLYFWLDYVSVCDTVC